MGLNPNIKGQVSTSALFNYKEMKINGSPDITNLVINATFDLSGTTPVIMLENLSDGNALASLSYAFVVKSPTQTIIHDGDITSPDVTGLWNQFIISDPWPRPFGNIEWSGAPYTFQAIIKDSNNNIFYGDVQDAPICRPNGNTPASRNYFGVGSTLVQVKCEQARIYFQNTTSASYRGVEGELLSSTLRVAFPMDETGVVPAPFLINNFSSALVPVTFSGKGYQFLASQIYLYEVSDNTFLKLKYVKNDVFGVWCNIDLLPLICEIQKLIDSIENGSCADAQAANQKLMLINSKFSLVMMGMLQPLTGVDVPALIQEIEDIGGFDCNCCGAKSGIVPIRASNLDGYSFELVPTCGDITGDVEINGYNVQILVGDKSYVFDVCDGSPAQTTAFSVRNSLDGCTKTYCLHIDVPQLAEDILNTIANDVNLVNLFNSIVLSAGDGNFQLVVDGGCIFSNSNSCDYTFTLNSIPVSATYAQLATVQTSGHTYTLNFAFNLTNLNALQNALNALGIGTWVANNPSGQTVVLTVTSTANITQVIYKNPNALVAEMIKQCTGYIPLSANQVVQNIINYLCDLTDDNVATATTYQICYIDPVDNQKKMSTLLAGAPLNQFIIELLAKGCQTIDYIKALGAVDCTAIMEKFPSRPAVAMQANDVFLATKQGQCAQINPIEAFYTMLVYGMQNADVKTAFCNFVASCAGGVPCAAYEYFYATVDQSSPDNENSELVVYFSHPEAIAHNIRYARIDNTNNPVYVTITGILPGDSPYVIAETPALSTGQYRVFIRPIYADGRLCQETMYETAPCTGVNAFSASYDGVNTINVTYNVDAGVPSVRLNLTYPNGGSASFIYNNGDVIAVTPPPNVFGTYFATLQPVCNVASGWYGEPSAPAAFVVNPPNNSSIINASSYNQFALQIYTITPNQTQLATMSLDAGNSQGFYMADGTYGGFFIQVDAADRDLMALQLVTGTGTYTGTRTSTNLFSFSGVQILNGATLTLTDDSSPSVSNYTLSASYNYSIESVSGSGVPVLPPTGINGNQSGSQSGITGTLTITLSTSTPPPSARLTLVINNTTEIDCVNLTGAGTYFLNAGTILSTDDVRIGVNFGSC